MMTRKQTEETFQHIVNLKRWCVWIADDITGKLDRVHVNAVSRDNAMVVAENENKGCYAYDAEEISK